MSDPKDESAIEQAMKDAVKAVEAREGGSADGGTEIEIEKGAAEAATPSKGSIEKELLETKRQLEETLQKASNDHQQLKDRWLRAAADLENYKKRWAKEREEIVKFANENLLKDFLPVVDDLDRTIEVLNRSGETGPLAEGVRMTHKKFLSQLEKHGVTSFSSLGEPFDPSRHEAVQQVNSDTVPAGGVAIELRRGFFLGGRLLRAAMVAISLGKNDGNGSASPNEKG